ncbi:hypothetical protein HWI79_3694 [Cryptosporidium felis]|nr:hypothetical protein HWI79_3694 [Cryptosporidium felis]
MFACASGVRAYMWSAWGAPHGKHCLPGIRVGRASNNLGAETRRVQDRVYGGRDALGYEVREQDEHHYQGEERQQRQDEGEQAEKELRPDYELELAPDDKEVEGEEYEKKEVGGLEVFVVKGQLEKAVVPGNYRVPNCYEEGEFSENQSLVYVGQLAPLSALQKKPKGIEKGPQQEGEVRDYQKLKQDRGDRQPLDGVPEPAVIRSDELCSANCKDVALNCLVLQKHALVLAVVAIAAESWSALRRPEVVLEVDGGAVARKQEARAGKVDCPQVAVRAAGSGASSIRGVVLGPAVLGEQDARVDDVEGVLGSHCVAVRRVAVGALVQLAAEDVAALGRTLSLEQSRTPGAGPDGVVLAEDLLVRPVLVGGQPEAPEVLVYRWGLAAGVGVPGSAWPLGELGGSAWQSPPPGWSPGTGNEEVEETVSLLDGDVPEGERGVEDDGQKRQRRGEDREPQGPQEQKGVGLLLDAGALEAEEALDSGRDFVEGVVSHEGALGSKGQRAQEGLGLDREVVGQDEGRGDLPLGAQEGGKDDDEPRVLGGDPPAQPLGGAGGASGGQRQGGAAAPVQGGALEGVGPETLPEVPPGVVGVRPEALLRLQAGHPAAQSQVPLLVGGGAVAGDENGDQDQNRKDGGDEHDRQDLPVHRGLGPEQRVLDEGLGDGDPLDVEVVKGLALLAEPGPPEDELGQERGEPESLEGEHGEGREGVRVLRRDGPEDEVHRLGEVLGQDESVDQQVRVVPGGVEQQVHEPRGAHFAVEAQERPQQREGLVVGASAGLRPLGAGRVAEGGGGEEPVAGVRNLRQEDDDQVLKQLHSDRLVGLAAVVELQENLAEGPRPRLEEREERELDSLLEEGVGVGGLVLPQGEFEGSVVGSEAQLPVLEQAFSGVLLNALVEQVREENREEVVSPEDADAEGVGLLQRAGLPGHEQRVDEGVQSPVGQEVAQDLGLELGLSPEDDADDLGGEEKHGLLQPVAGALVPALEGGPGAAQVAVAVDQVEDYDPDHLAEAVHQLAVLYDDEHLADALEVGAGVVGGDSEEDLGEALDAPVQVQGLDQKGPVGVGVQHEQEGKDVHQKDARRVLGPRARVLEHQVHEPPSEREPEGRLLVVVVGDQQLQRDHLVVSRLVGVADVALGETLGVEVELQQSEDEPGVVQLAGPPENGQSLVVGGGADDDVHQRDLDLQQLQEDLLADVVSDAQEQSPGRRVVVFRDVLADVELLVGVPLRLYQDGEHVDPVFEHREGNRVEPRVVPEPGEGPEGQQRADRLLEVHHERVDERGVSQDVPEVGVRALLEEVVHQSDVQLADRVEEGRPAVGVRGVQLGLALLDQQPHDLLVLVLAGEQERSVAVLAVRVHGGSQREQVGDEEVPDFPRDLAGRAYFGEEAGDADEPPDVPRGDGLQELHGCGEPVAGVPGQRGLGELHALLELRQAAGRVVVGLPHLGVVGDLVPVLPFESGAPPRVESEEQHGREDQDQGSHGGDAVFRGVGSGGGLSGSRPWRVQEGPDTLNGDLYSATLAHIWSAHPGLPAPRSQSPGEGAERAEPLRGSSSPHDPCSLRRSRKEALPTDTGRGGDEGHSAPAVAPKSRRRAPSYLETALLQRRAARGRELLGSARSWLGGRGVVFRGLEAQVDGDQEQEDGGEEQREPHRGVEDLEGRGEEGQEPHGGLDGVEQVGADREDVVDVGDPLPELQSEPVDLHHDVHGVDERGTEEEDRDGHGVPEADGPEGQGEGLHVQVRQGEDDGGEREDVSEEVDRLPEVLADAVGGSPRVRPDEERVDLGLQDLVVGGLRLALVDAGAEPGAVEVQLLQVLVLHLGGVLVEPEEAAQPELGALGGARVPGRGSGGGPRDRGAALETHPPGPGVGGRGGQALLGVRVVEGGVLARSRGALRDPVGGGPRAAVLRDGRVSGRPLLRRKHLLARELGGPDGVGSAHLLGRVGLGDQQLAVPGGVEVVQGEDHRQDRRGDHREQLPVVDEEHEVEDGDGYGVEPRELVEVRVLELVELPAGIEAPQARVEVRQEDPPVASPLRARRPGAPQRGLGRDDEGERETQDLDDEEDPVALEGLLQVAVGEPGDLQEPADLGDHRVGLPRAQRVPAGHELLDLPRRGVPRRGTLRERGALEVSVEVDGPLGDPDDLRVGLLVEDRDLREQEVVVAPEAGPELAVHGLVQPVPVGRVDRDGDAGQQQEAGQLLVQPAEDDPREQKQHGDELDGVEEPREAHHVGEEGELEELVGVLRVAPVLAGGEAGHPVHQEAALERVQEPRPEAVAGGERDAQHQRESEVHGEVAPRLGRRRLAPEAARVPDELLGDGVGDGVEAQAGVEVDGKEDQDCEEAQHREDQVRLRQLLVPQERGHGGPPGAAAEALVGGPEAAQKALPRTEAARLQEARGPVLDQSQEVQALGELLRREEPDEPRGQKRVEDRNGVSPALIPVQDRGGPLKRGEGVGVEVLEVPRQRIQESQHPVHLRGGLVVDPGENLADRLGTQLHDGGDDVQAGLPEGEGEDRGEAGEEGPLAGGGGAGQGGAPGALGTLSAEAPGGVQEDPEAPPATLGRRLRRERPRAGGGVASAGGSLPEGGGSGAQEVGEGVRGAQVESDGVLEELADLLGGEVGRASSEDQLLDALGTVVRRDVVAGEDGLELGREYEEREVLDGDAGGGVLGPGLLVLELEVDVGPPLVVEDVLEVGVVAGEEALGLAEEPPLLRVGEAPRAVSLAGPCLGGGVLAQLAAQEAARLVVQVREVALLELQEGGDVDVLDVLEHLDGVADSDPPERGAPHDLLGVPDGDLREEEDHPRGELFEHGQVDGVRGSASASAGPDVHEGVGDVELLLEREDDAAQGPQRLLGLGEDLQNQGGVRPGVSELQQVDDQLFGEPERLADDQVDGVDAVLVIPVRVAALVPRPPVPDGPAVEVEDALDLLDVSVVGGPPEGSPPVSVGHPAEGRDLLLALHPEQSVQQQVRDPHLDDVQHVPRLLLVVLELLEEVLAVEPLLEGLADQLQVGPVLEGRVLHDHGGDVFRGGVDVVVVVVHDPLDHLPVVLPDGEIHHVQPGDRGYPERVSPVVHDQTQHRSVVVLQSHHERVGAGPGVPHVDAGSVRDQDPGHFEVVVLHRVVQRGVVVVVHHVHEEVLVAASLLDERGGFGGGLRGVLGALEGRGPRPQEVEVELRPARRGVSAVDGGLGGVEVLERGGRGRGEHRRDGKGPERREDLLEVREGLHGRVVSELGGRRGRQGGEGRRGGGGRRGRREGVELRLVRLFLGAGSGGGVALFLLPGGPDFGDFGEDGLDDGVVGASDCQGEELGKLLENADVQSVVQDVVPALGIEHLGLDVFELLAVVFAPPLVLVIVVGDVEHERLYDFQDAFGAHVGFKEVRDQVERMDVVDRDDGVLLDEGVEGEEHGAVVVDGGVELLLGVGFLFVLQVNNALKEVLRVLELTAQEEVLGDFREAHELVDDLRKEAFVVAENVGFPVESVFGELLQPRLFVIVALVGIFAVGNGASDLGRPYREEPGRKEQGEDWKKQLQTEPREAGHSLLVRLRSLFPVWICSSFQGLDIPFSVASHFRLPLQRETGEGGLLGSGNCPA